MYDLYNQNMMSNSFVGYYVDDYNMVLNSATPTNASVVFADLNHGRLYSKKLVNGVPMISTFELKPLYGEQSKPEPEKITQDDINKAILDKLDNLERRINEKSTTDGNDVKDEKS
nr:MAG TPA: hypothetical protein [Caudoviricetes sp.]